MTRIRSHARTALTDPGRAVRAARRRFARTARIPQEPFAVFQRRDASSLELWNGYRDRIKARWRGSWWQTRVLLELRSRVALPPELEELATALLQERTLPASLAEIAAAVRPLAEVFPDEVVVFGDELEPAPTDEDLDAWERYYARAARSLLASARGFGVVRTGRALEIGCGSGTMSMALASAGFGEVVGCDLEIERYGTAIGRSQLYERLVPAGATVRFETADASALPYESGSFDLAFSTSVLEHVHDPASVLAELRRVLRPGGLALHNVDPWFSPQGGHSRCILDAPWGHVRLAREELERYLTRFRPHEAEDALRSYDKDFQSPRLALAQLADAFGASGFRIVELKTARSPTAAAHRRLLTPAVAAECARIYPQATTRDLLTDSVTVVAEPL